MGGVRFENAPCAATVDEETQWAAGKAVGKKLGEAIAQEHQAEEDPKGRDWPVELGSGRGGMESGHEERNPAEDRLFPSVRAPSFAGIRWDTRRYPAFDISYTTGLPC
ncbi:MAG: hypothetical protein NVSMB17_04400 [Candidatus Dormibacteria bacterium]